MTWRKQWNHLRVRTESTPGSTSARRPTIHRSTTDPAVEFRQIYLAHCKACRQAGIPEPTPEEWVQRIDEYVSDPPESADER